MKVCCQVIFCGISFVLGKVIGCVFLLCPGIPQSEISNRMNNKQFLDILYGVIPCKDLNKASSGRKFMKELLQLIKLVILTPSGGMTLLCMIFICEFIVLAFPSIIITVNMFVTCNSCCSRHLKHMHWQSVNITLYVDVLME